MEKFIGLILLVLIIACSKDIVVEQPDYDSKIVVDGYISDNGYAYVYLTQSSPFLTDYDSASIRATFVNDAKVTVADSKGNKEILTLFRKDEFFPPFVYRTIQLKGEAGGTYDLKIEVDGKVIESTTTVPELPNVLSVDTYHVSDTTMLIDVEIEDDLSQERFYYSEIKVKGLDSIFHQASFPLVRNNEFTEGTNYVRVHHSNQPDPLNLYKVDTVRNVPAYEFSIKDTVYLKFSCVDKISFEVLNDIYLDRINSENPFAFVNKKTGTNIRGGIGRWTGLATRYFVVSDKTED